MQNSIYKSIQAMSILLSDNLFYRISTTDLQLFITNSIDLNNIQMKKINVTSFAIIFWQYQ